MASSGNSTTMSGTLPRNSERSLWIDAQKTLKNPSGEDLCTLGWLETDVELDLRQTIETAELQ